MLVNYSDAADKILDYLLRDGEQSGPALRERLNDELRSETDLQQHLTRAKLDWLFTFGISAFYQIMGRLERSGEVRSFRKEDDSKIAWYRITEDGRAVMHEKLMAVMEGRLSIA